MVQFKKIKWDRAVQCLALAFLFQSILFTLPVFSQTDSLKTYIGVRQPEKYDPRVNVINPSDREFLGLHMSGARNPFYRVDQVSSIQRKVEIDSTGENINLTEKLGEMDFMLPNYLTLDDYIMMRRMSRVQNKWTQTAVDGLDETSKRRGGSSGFRIDIPVEIKNKAFQQIFGSGNVGLDVSGEINIRGGFRNEKRSEVKSALNRGSDNNFKMEQTQRFKVEGHIGDKVTIGIDQDSERTFDFDNNIKLQYEGYEDEIIQSVQAGNIALSLPGTKFVTFGGKSNGLFGIKAAATIGNLKLTAIASQEKGEKKRLELNGGASEDAAQIQDYQYKKGIYFFIDNVYRDNYLNRTDNGDLTYNPDRVITDFDVYKSGPSYESRNTESVFGYAVVPQQAFGSGEDLSTTVPARDREKYEGYFIQLEKNQDYFIDERLGFIRLNQRLNEDEVLSIAYKDQGGVEYGTVDFFGDSTQTDLYTKMLRNKNPRPKEKPYDLEWKNVYDFGRGTPKEGFEMRIFFKPSSGEAQETVQLSDGKTITWLEFFGLDKRNEYGAETPDNLVDENDAIINFSTGEVFFPDLRPFDPVDPKNQELFDKLKDDLLEPEIYDTTAQNAINAASNFYIEVNAKKRSSEYSLGMNVIENSEEVLLNNNPLQRGVDYTIDYFSGRLVILNEEALGVNANLDISYESNQLFQIDKKTVMGARAEYGLWDDSFIGATFLYLNESTLDQKVRVGKGPMRNMVWDVNSSLTVKPFFMTRLINLLPFVDSRDETTIKFEGEIAQIIPNPNTRNNELTGDNDGVAYIDDFEASKRSTPITITHQTWEYCSPPVGRYDYNGDLRARSKMYYYTPYVATPIKEIWPNRDVNSQVNQSVNIMKMVMTPSDSGEASWNGIMKSLSSGYSNQTETKFIELWVKANSGNLHIDIGQISEDIIPNKIYNTEDKKVNLIRNGLLDEDEDIGLDGMSDNDERALSAGGDFWDLNDDGIKTEGEPYSDDNWLFKLTQSSTTVDNNDYQKVNGTEGNRNEGGTIYPDTEDLNGNGTLDLDNNYFSYQFSLRRDHPDTMWISGKSINKDDGKDNGWRQYRIPINAPDPTRKIVGNPDLSLIEYIRIWVDGLPAGQVDTISIAEVNLVGSDWKEMGVSVPDSSFDEYDVDNDSTVTVTVVNTHDNPEYKAPPGVQGEVDQITQVIAKEQALVLKVEGLEPGATGAVQKTFYDAQSYINYKTFKMFVYGKDPFGEHVKSDDSNIEFFIRMGADINNYYEIREPIYEGWSKNSIEVDLIALSQLKVTADSIYYLEGDSTVEYRSQNAGDGVTWMVKGRPALTNVRMLMAGIRNTDKDGKSFYGEIYLNEMRLSNVKKDKGIAMRSQISFDLANILKVNADFNKMDADFHNVQQRFGTGDNEVSGSINSTLQVGKLLPSRLGLSLPVTVNYSKSESTPKYIPSTDIEVNDDLPSATLDSITTLNERRGMNMSLGINSRSKNFFIKHLIMPFKMNYSRNETNRKDARTKKATNTSESGSVNWNINFGNNNYFRPFKWLGDSPLLVKFSDFKLYFTPKTITTSHSSARNKNYSLTYSKVETENGTFSLNRRYGLNMNVTEALSFDINRQYAHDMRGVDKDTLLTKIQEFKFGFLTSINNDFGVKYSPKIFSWFTTTFSYNAKFKFGYNRQQKLAPRSGTLDRNYSASGDLNLGNFAKSIYKPGNKRQSTRKNGDDKEGDSKPFFRVNVLGLTSSLLNVFEPFRVSYTTRDNVSRYGLDGVPFEGFQFGFTQDPGRNVEASLLDEGQTSSFNQATSSESKNMSVNSGLKLGRNMTFRLKYDKSNSINSNGRTITGQRKESWSKDIDAPFPGWTFNMRGLEKAPFIKNYFQSISLDHNFTGSSGETFEMLTDDSTGLSYESITKSDQDNSFRPLVGVSMRMKNGIAFNVKYNMSVKDVTSISNTIKRTTTNDLNVTLTYSKSGNFRIPLPFLSSKRLKNKIDMSVTYSKSLNMQEDSKAGEDFVSTSETSKWFLKPDINYSFSNRVRGGLFFEIGKTHNKLMGDNSYKELGLNVSITISGS